MIPGRQCDDVLRFNARDTVALGDILDSTGSGNIPQHDAAIFRPHQLFLIAIDQLGPAKRSAEFQRRCHRSPDFPIPNLREPRGVVDDPTNP